MSFSVTETTLNIAANDSIQYSISTNTPTLTEGNSSEVKGDRKVEANETFFVNLYGAANSIFPDRQ